MMVLHPSLHHEYEIKCFFSLSLPDSHQKWRRVKWVIRLTPMTLGRLIQGFSGVIWIYFATANTAWREFFIFYFCARNHCKKTTKKIYYNTVTCHRVKWNTYVAHSLHNLQYADHDILLETLKNMYKLNGCTAVLYAAEMKHTILKCERLRMKHVCQTRDTSSYLIMSTSGLHRTL